MSQLIIHYGSLETAAQMARDTGNKLSDYAEKAQKRIANKISAYSGEHTGNITSAQTYINQKINQLNQKSAAFLQYASDVDRFAQSAKATDKGVKERIGSLSGTFKDNYGIKDSVITNIFNFISDKLNESNLGRFFKDMVQTVWGKVESLKDGIVEWYKYDGGKYIVDGVKAAAMAVAAIAAITTIGNIIVVAASIVVAAIAVANALFAITTSAIAYGKEKSGDPAWAKRYGDLDTMADTMRTKSNSENDHIAADVTDTVEFVANAICIGAKGVEGFENFKKIAGAQGGFKDYFKNLYTKGKEALTSKDGFKAFAKRRLDAVKNTVKLYKNPENWFMDSQKKLANKGYSPVMEGLGIGDISKFVIGNGETGGFEGIMSGADRSFKNIVDTLGKAKSILKPVDKLKDWWKPIGPNLVVKEDGKYKSYHVSAGDVTGLVSDVVDEIKIAKKVFTNAGDLMEIRDLRNLRTSWQTSLQGT